MDDAEAYGGFHLREPWVGGVVFFRVCFQFAGNSVMSENVCGRRNIRCISRSGGRAPRSHNYLVRRQVLQIRFWNIHDYFPRKDGRMAWSEGGEDGQEGKSKGKYQIMARREERMDGWAD